MHMEHLVYTKLCVSVQEMKHKYIFSSGLKFDLYFIYFLLLYLHAQNPGKYFKASKSIVLKKEKMVPQSTLQEN